MGCFEPPKSSSCWPWRNFAPLPHARPMRAAYSSARVAAVDGLVDQHQPAAALQEGVEVLALVGLPAGVAGVDHDHVGRLQLLGGRPARRPSPPSRRRPATAASASASATRDNRVRPGRGPSARPTGRCAACGRRRPAAALPFSTASTSARLRGGGAPSRSSGAGCSGSVSRNVSRSRICSGPRAFSSPSGMIDRADGCSASTSDAAGAELLPLAVADHQLVALGARHAGQHPAVLQLDEIGEIVGIDGGAGLADVAQDRVVIAVDQVGQVRADAAAAAADLMALRALGLVAEEDLAAARPVAALQFRECRGPRPSGASAGRVSAAHGRRKRFSGSARGRSSSLVE